MLHQFAQHRIFGHCGAHALGDSHCGNSVGLRQHGGKFFAAIAGYEIIVTQIAFQNTCHFAQHLVTHSVSCIVVDGFEMIDVNHQRRQRQDRTGLVMQEQRSTLKEVTAICQSGQRVNLRQALQRGTAAVQLLHQLADLVGDRHGNNGSDGG